MNRNVRHRVSAAFDRSTVDVGYYHPQAMSTDPENLSKLGSVHYNMIIGLI